MAMASLDRRSWTLGERLSLVLFLFLCGAGGGGAEGGRSACRRLNRRVQSRHISRRIQVRQVIGSGGT